MDMATVIGVIMGALLIGVTAFLGGEPGAFLSVSGLVIVFGGVTAGTFIRYRMNEISVVFKLIGRCFFSKRRKVGWAITQLVDMANISRKEGILALERIKSEDPFMQSALNHCVDGAEPDFLSYVLTREIEYMSARHEKGIRMLESIGEMAPAFGMLATLAGLVQVLTNMNHADTVGPAMATALLGTFYGVALANLFMFPLAAKLEVYHADEAQVQYVIRDGILAIQKGVIPPHLLKQALSIALPPDQRKSL